MSEPSPGVGIHEGSASKQFLRILQGACDAFPEAFEGLRLPTSSPAFRDQYADVLPRFEACRQGAAAPGQIAQHLFAESQVACTFWDGSQQLSLADAVRRDAAPYPLTALPDSDAPPDLSVPFRGARLRGAPLQAWLDGMRDDHKITTGAHEALSDVTARPGLDLSGRRVVILGAGAALAPVSLLRQAGADVLWIDLQPPDPAVVTGAGSLRYVAEGADLLRAPDRIRATMLDFAEGGAMDVCLFAYAPGRGREWRLAAAMNAIVDALPDASVRTVSLFVSPSVPTRLSAREQARAEQLRQQRPWWQGLAARLGMLGRGDGHVESGDVAVSRSVLSTQGVSYQAAQYLSKAMAAEAWRSQAAPLRVSANTAPVSLTPSLDKPFFRLAFHGARVFGIEAFAPATTRQLSGLLMVRDWLAPDAGPPVRIHGGAHGIAYPAEQAMQVSFLAGVAWPWGQQI